MTRWLAWAVVLLGLALPAHGQKVKLVIQEPDPYGIPRPGAGAKNVPLRTSLYVELGLESGASSNVIQTDSVTIRLRPAGGEAFDVLKAGRQFASGYSGRFVSRGDMQGNLATGVYATSETPLKPSTDYTIQVSARSPGGETLDPKTGTWTFTTEAAPLTHEASVAVDLRSPPVRWQGAFFSGFCKPSFCTSDPVMIGTYELMDETRRRSPGAWSLQRDFWMTGMDRRPEWMSPQLPGIVRERETRRIVAVAERPEGTQLRVEDLFGHEQYGIPANRPLSEDYHAKDEVLIADGVHDARATVLATDDQAHTVLVKRVPAPKGGWLMEYTAPLPKQEDPNAPGLFPPGGCYLLKFKPSGTPCYYWGRLDKEWDIAHRRFGHRLMPNIADAPGDLSIDGRNWTTAKDYAELHEVVRTIVGHVIDRYGEASLSFIWSVFNEPDLGGMFWRTNWDELQRFYDYSTDATLRAFEDRGYDSNRVFIGGLELGGIFGTNLKLREFLTHCSPRAKGKGALPTNAAFADARLNGKRSKRVEALCRANGGKGAPCDFVSVHAYNRSEMMAAKLARAKQMALEIDPDYYAKLWVNSHEACPNWLPPPDPAAADSYLGNGYFPTWCADVARRQLQAAAKDPRYAFGETILTFWLGPNENFSSLNNCTRVINVDDNGDGKSDRGVLVPMPILNFLGLLSGMGGDYWVLPEQTYGGDVVSGFASRTEDDVRVLLYAHNATDTQSRSDHQFTVSLDLAGLPWPRVRVVEYAFDRDRNSYYRLGQQLRDRPPVPSAATTRPVSIDELIRTMKGADAKATLAALDDLATLGSAAQSAIPLILKFAGETKDEAIRSAALATMRQISPSGGCYSPEEVSEVRALSQLRATGSTTPSTDPDGRLRLTTTIESNGANYLIIEPDGPTSTKAEP